MSAADPKANVSSEVSLHLNWRGCISSEDHEITTLDLCVAAQNLANWADCVDDGCARRIGHELGQGLLLAGTVWPGCKRKRVGLLRSEPGNGGLKDLS